MNTFCKQDQKDLVRYLQRQLIARDQRIVEQSYDIEKFKNSSEANNINDNNTNINKKTAPIQILRNSDPDVVISAVSQIKLYYFLPVLLFIHYYLLELSCNMFSFLLSVDDSPRYCP